LASLQFSYALRIPTGIALLDASQNVVPTSISIEITSTPTPPFNAIQVNTARYVVRAVGSIFVEFFEDNREWLDNWATGSRPRARPRTLFLLYPGSWQFGRLIRNALAHGGDRLNIYDKSFIPVSWRSLTYGPKDDGRQIFGRDLTAGDMIYLMMEMANDLDRIGCPI
jgi:hypothetical protein